jgi:hypothetical protein
VGQRAEGSAARQVGLERQWEGAITRQWRQPLGDETLRERARAEFALIVRRTRRRRCLSVSQSVSLKPPWSLWPDTMRCEGKNRIASLPLKRRLTGR